MTRRLPSVSCPPSPLCCPSASTPRTGCHCCSIPGPERPAGWEILSVAEIHLLMNHKPTVCDCTPQPLPGEQRELQALSPTLAFTHTYLRVSKALQVYRGLSAVYRAVYFITRFCHSFFPSSLSLFSLASMLTKRQIAHILLKGLTCVPKWLSQLDTLSSLLL